MDIGIEITEMKFKGKFATSLSKSSPDYVYNFDVSFQVKGVSAVFNLDLETSIIEDKVIEKLKALI